MGDPELLRGESLPLLQRLRRFTPVVAWMTIYLSLAALNFGYDVGTFGGVQAMQPFARRFGAYNPAKRTYSLPPYLSSIMNSMPFLGKLVGALVCGPLIERFGRKSGVAALACISLIGVTLQTSAMTAAQFTVGRVINFAMTGMVIVVMPIYMGECSPPELRGLISSTLQFQISFGQLVASLVNLRTQTFTTDASWRIPIGLQFIVPAVILVLLPTMPESPRWLVAKGRTEDAVRCLRKLRGKKASGEIINAEIRLWTHTSSNEGKGPWKDLFNSYNRKRTTVAVLAMFFQQVTGQAFPSQYSVVFYQQQNISNSFLWSTIGNVVGLATVTWTSLVVDGFGRRPILFIGGALMALFMYMIAGVGSSSTANQADQAEKNVIIASVILFGASYAMSWAPTSYTILSEAASSKVKEKTNDLAVSVSVLTTFVVSFTLPYLLNAPYAALGARVGYIYGSLCVVAVVVTWFCIPEMKGRTLEEVDELFESGIPMWKWRGAYVPSQRVDNGGVHELNIEGGDYGGRISSSGRSRERSSGENVANKTGHDRSNSISNSQHKKDNFG